MSGRGHRGSLSAVKAWLLAHGLLEQPRWRAGQTVIPAEQTTRHADGRNPTAIRTSSWVRAPLTHLYVGDPVAYLDCQRPQEPCEPDILPYARPSTALMRDPLSGRARRVLLNMPAPPTDHSLFTQFRRALVTIMPSIRAGSPSVRRAALLVLATAASGILGQNAPGLLVLEPATAAAVCGRPAVTWRRGLAELIRLNLESPAADHGSCVSP